jgi:catechol 2,3-dioxygenase-like lactoylglutathione lyase family enzyme
MDCLRLSRRTFRDGGSRQLRIAPLTSRAVKVEVAFTGVPVSDLARGQDFFERLFGAPPDVLVNDDEVMWQVAEAAWLYVVVDRHRAGSALAAVSVPDLDGALAELASRGIEPTTIERPGPSARKATVLDPDGNSIAVIEVREA